MLALLAQADTTTTTTTSGAGVAIFLIFFVVYLAFIVLMIASMWKVFEKAGQKGWTAIIPILNIIVLLKVVHKEIWWIILFIIPCVSIVAWIIVAFDLAKAYGKGAGYGLGLIILPFIFMPILGFGSAQYALAPDPLF
jgi:hypothetical protein